LWALEVGVANFFGPIGRGKFFFSGRAKLFFVKLIGIDEKNAFQLKFLC